MSTNDDMTGHLAGLRKRLGLAQGAVAERLGVSTSLISHWERGERVPSEAQWLELAAVYGVPHDYLRSPVVRPQFQCRTQVTLSAEEKSATLHALVRGEAQVDALNKVWAMANRMPTQFPLRMDYAEPSLPDLARQVRDHFKLNRAVTFGELKQASQERNIHVFEWHLPPKLSGFSYRGAFTVAVINRDHDEARRLFTLSHELAHLLFHLGRDRQSAISLMASTRDPLEKEANAFASELLLPADEMERRRRDWGAARLREPGALTQIAETFHVSRLAVFHRLCLMGVTRWQDKSLYFQKGAPGVLPVQLVTEWEPQVDAELGRQLLALHEAEELTTGKVAEWSTAPRYVVERFLERQRTDESLPAELYETDEVSLA